MFLPYHHHKVIQADMGELVETELAVEVEQEQQELIHQDLLEDQEEQDQERFMVHQQHHQVLLFTAVEVVELVIMEQMDLEDQEEDHQHQEQQQLILEAEAEADLLQPEVELEVLEELLLDNKHQALLAILLVDGL
jgi:hypothetical protein